ncbi:hypothetical protein [Meiothermus granaticius]|uniref:Uncharacterized protein n=1 Tax=Meiothermus granaticius NBRC 107808 TaxID=1227551 RepID=A0A399FCK2_9DEIN|nr:hypothetical protein [Meiothermus granaticius]RIH93970.1 hypothetical protein Mgrana_00056 [Meiothermus granaticius NBRC 107808]GEM88202.1 hypothetical protein MGR01S_28270 [Meiothermus granaticius NBRC 107808]
MQNPHRQQTDDPEARPRMGLPIEFFLTLGGSLLVLAFLYGLMALVAVLS